MSQPTAEARGINHSGQQKLAVVCTYSIVSAPRPSLRDEWIQPTWVCMMASLVPRALDWLTYRHRSSGRGWRRLVIAQLHPRSITIDAGRAGARSGQSLVELTLLLPVLLIVVLGAVNVGLAIRAQTQLAQVAQQAAQYLVHHPDYADTTNGKLLAYVNSLSSVQLNVASLTVTVGTSTITVSSSPVAVQEDTVHISYAFPVLFPLAGALSVGALHDGSLSLGATASTIAATDPPSIAVSRNAVSGRHTISLTPPPTARAVGVIPYTYCIYRVYTAADSVTYTSTINDAGGANTAPACSTPARSTNPSYVDQTPYANLVPPLPAGTPTVIYYASAVQQNLLESPRSTPVAGQ